MKKALVWIVILALVGAATGCSARRSDAVDLKDSPWEETVSSCRGTTVNLYGWGGSEVINKWLDTEVATVMKTKYGIELNRVPMNIDEILAKLVSEKQIEAEGTIDVVWLNGENFYTAKTNDLLFGPFTNKLPNFTAFVDGDNPDNAMDFGFPTDGYESPYGKAQFVLIGNPEMLGGMPTDHVQLLEMAKANPGKLTYPAPPDFTGSAFVRNVIYDTVGYEPFTTVSTDKEAVRQLIQPAMDYLAELKPYLWREGKTYPATNALVDQMYSDGELLMTMNYNPNHVAVKIGTGEFDENSVAAVFDKGSVGNTHFLAVPSNATNKAAALVLINEILSPELQASKYNPDNWGDLPVLDDEKLNDEQRQLFSTIPLGPGVPELSELLNKRLPEMPARLVPIIEEIWLETIPEKGQ